jgi:hypothetical protein
MAEPTLLRRAITEFTAITVGVLVALAIDAAWTARGDRLLEQAYLERVIEEAESNARLLGFTIERADWARDNLDRATNIAELGLVDDSASVFVESLANATSFMARPVVSVAVVQDLVSTGNLGLIRSTEVRQAILSMDATVKAFGGIITQAESEVASGLEPLVSQFIPPRVLSRDDAVGVGVTVDDSPESEEALVSAANRISSDPMFERSINSEYRRIQRGRETSLRLQNSLAGYAERLTEMVSTT